MLCILCLVGCSNGNATESDARSKEVLSETYNIGDEIELAGVQFNIYKVEDDSNELYLMAQTNCAVTTYSDSEREQKYMNEYEGSLIEGQVSTVVDSLEDAGIIVKSAGIIDKEDLIELGFDIDGLGGTQYKIGNAPDFLQNEEHFWVDGYCKYDTYAWVYCNGILTTKKCEEAYGVRPVIVIDVAEIDKTS